MSQVDVDAQLENLRELWLTDSDLSFLRAVEPSVLERIVSEARAHHERVAAGQAVLFESMAKTTRFVPNFLLGKLGAPLSSYVLARIAEHLEPKAAASMSKAFDPARLADISLHLPPQLAAQIAGHTDIDTLSVIIDTLARKGLSRRLGEVSDVLDEKMLEKLVDRMKDPERLASIAAHMTRADRVARVGRRLDAKLRTAVVSLLEREGHSSAAALLGT